MAIPTSINDLDTSDALNSPSGSDMVGGTLDNFLRSHAAIIKRQFSKGPDINSASTTLVPPDWSYMNVIKVVSTINAFSTNFAGRVVFFKFEAGITLAHSSSLILPSATNVVTQDGDVACFVSEAPGVWRCVSYPRLYQFSDKVNVAQGTTSDDPNTTPYPVIVTQHANAPEGANGTYWHITTTFLSPDKTGSRAQTALSYNSPTARIAVRHFFNGSWTPWVFSQPAGNYMTMAGGKTDGQLGSKTSLVADGGNVYLNAAGSVGVRFNGSVVQSFGAPLYSGDNAVWHAGNFNPATKANAGAAVVFNSATVEFGTAVGGGGGVPALDLPDPYVLTGLRAGVHVTDGVIQYLLLRARTLRI